MPLPAVAMLGDVVNATEEAIEIAEWVTDLIAQKCWEGNWSVADKHGTPIKNIKSDEHIRAWINITGFEEESIINGTHYVNGSAKDFAIVERDAWYTSVGGTVVSFTTEYSIGDSIIGNATNNKTNTTTASQTTNFHWKYWVPTFPIGGYWVHVYEGPLIVSCTVPSPKNLTSRILDVNIDVKIYNHSINPVTYINIPEIEDVMITRVTYNNSTISRYSQIGWVTQNERGTELVEFVDHEIPVWDKDEDQTEIDHQGGFVTILDPDFNVSKLNIKFIAPYEVRNATTFSVQKVSGHASVPIEVFKLILTLIGAIAFLILLIGVIKRSI